MPLPSPPGRPPGWVPPGQAKKAVSAIAPGAARYDVRHRVYGYRSGGAAGFLDGHTLAEIMTILGDRDVRMFLPFFERNAVDDTPVQDLGPRGHHFLKHTTGDYAPFIKGHVNAYRLNGVNEAFDMADHDDFSFGDSVDDSPFSLGIAVRFNDVSNNTLISRIDFTNLAEEVEYMLYMDGADRLSFINYDNADMNYIGRIYNVALTSYRWYIIIGTYDGSCAVTGFRIYLDGTRVDNLDTVAGAYTAMHNESVVTAVGYYEDAAGALVRFLDGDCWGPFITGKELTAGEAVKLTNLYRRCLGL